MRSSAHDFVILELSSFQLELMTRSPHIAAVLNITPNHLDRHGSMQAYTAAKARILDFQTPHDTAVLGREDPGAWNLRERVQGTPGHLWFEAPRSRPGRHLRADEQLYVHRRQRQPMLASGRASILLRGDHNRLNVLAACALGLTAGFPADALRAGVEGFGGVPHRLELVREVARRALVQRLDRHCPRTQHGGRTFLQRTAGAHARRSRQKPALG